MLKFWFYLTEGVSDLIKNKGRSFLTSLGIIIGVYSVVMLLALGEGLKVYIAQQFENLGSSLIYITPGKISQTGPNFTGKRFSITDYQRLKSSIQNATLIPSTVTTTSFSINNKTQTITVVGSVKEIFSVLNLSLAQGRAFSKSEELSGRKVVVLGAKIAEDLFENSNPIQQTIKIRDLRFVIVGVLEEKGGGSEFDSRIFTPYKTIHSINGEKNFLAFYLKPYNEDDQTQIIKKAEKIMLKSFKEDDFSITTQEELMKTINSIFTMLNIGLVGIAAISLLVGGIGITNIMYVTVTERTREVGIRRAIGATQNDVLFQFLVQSVMLTTLGGIIALVLAYLTATIVYSFFPVTITTLGVCLSFFVSFFIGVIFGVFPATKAARLSPVEAIRYE